MIVSHAHRFLYVRPKKVASSSVFIALQQHLQPNDLIGKDGQLMRKTGVSKPVPTRSGKGLWKLRPHASLQRISYVLGPEILKYRIITLARNPWDRAVSEYYWYRSVHKGTQVTEDVQKDFEAFLLKRARLGAARRFVDRLEGRKRISKMEQSELCTLDGTFFADNVVFYENLQVGLEELSKEMGLDIKLPEKREKGEVRDKKSRDWRSFYTDKGVEIVAKACANDIKLFGYSFDEDTPPSFVPSPLRSGMRKSVA